MTKGLLNDNIVLCGCSSKWVCCIHGGSCEKRDNLFKKERRLLGLVQGSVELPVSGCDSTIWQGYLELQWQNYSDQEYKVFKSFRTDFKCSHSHERLILVPLKVTLLTVIKTACIVYTIALTKSSNIGIGYWMHVTHLHMLVSRNNRYVFYRTCRNKYGLNDENGLEENYWKFLLENKDGRNRKNEYVFLDIELTTASLNFPSLRRKDSAPRDQNYTGPCLYMMIKNNNSYYGFRMNGSIDEVLNVSISSNLINIDECYTTHSLQNCILKWIGSGLKTFKSLCVFIMPAYLCIYVCESTHLWLFMCVETKDIFFTVDVFLYCSLLCFLESYLFCYVTFGPPFPLFLFHFNIYTDRRQQTDRQITDSVCERKCDIYLPESVLFFFPRRSPISFIFLKMTQFPSLWLSKVPFVYYHIFFIYSYIDWHFHWVYIVTAVNSWKINMNVKVSASMLSWLSLLCRLSKVWVLAWF